MDNYHIPKYCQTCKLRQECNLVEDGWTDICKHLVPVSEGNVHRVEIVGKSQNGEGIAQIKNFDILVPETNIGDNLRVKIERIETDHAIAFKVDVKSKTPKNSKDRLVPYSMSSNSDGELIPKSPWGSSDKKINRNGAKCGKCKECGGSLVWDSQEKCSFCQKCGLEG